ncbi:hypothetical protein QYF36_020657 [Acer negundo]|nr:hypothetical protein QYF36_026320 [Acer negundo]KAK4839279.1 hypothetical protein QYF36_020657 [Acer negundo]
MLTSRVSLSAAAIRKATETNTANAADTEAAYRRSFAYLSGVNDAAFSVTETAGPWDGPAYWLNALHTKNEIIRSAGIALEREFQYNYHCLAKSNSWRFEGLRKEDQVFFANSLPKGQVLLMLSQPRARAQNGCNGNPSCPLLVGCPFFELYKEQSSPWTQSESRNSPRIHLRSSRTLPYNRTRKGGEVLESSSLLPREIGMMGKPPLFAFVFGDGRDEAIVDQRVPPRTHRIEGPLVLCPFFMLFLQWIELKVKFTILTALGTFSGAFPKKETSSFARRRLVASQEGD